MQTIVVQILSARPELVFARMIIAYVHEVQVVYPTNLGAVRGFL